MKVRVALLAGSPVYYQAPLFRLLAQDPRIDFTAIFSSSAGATRPYDNEFGMPVDWGVDSLGGYRHRFLRKADSNPTGGSPLSLRDYDVVPLLLAERYDVLWIQGYHTVTGVLARLTQAVTRGATCYRDDANLLTPRPRWKTLLKTVGLRPLFAGSTGLFFGTANRAWFRRWGMRDDQLFFVPHAADYNRLLASAPQGRTAREPPLESLAKGPVILTVGRLMAKKNPLMLLEAFRRVRERRDCTLLVVGSGELEPAMRARAEAGNVADVKFAGFLSQREIGRGIPRCGRLLPSFRLMRLGGWWSTRQWPSASPWSSQTALAVRSTSSRRAKRDSLSDMTTLQPARPRWTRSSRTRRSGGGWARTRRELFEPGITRPLMPA